MMCRNVVLSLVAIVAMAACERSPPSKEPVPEKATEAKEEKVAAVDPAVADAERICSSKDSLVDGLVVSALDLNCPSGGYRNPWGIPESVCQAPDGRLEGPHAVYSYIGTGGQDSYLLGPIVSYGSNHKDKKHGRWVYCHEKTLEIVEYAEGQELSRVAMTRPNSG